MSVKLLLSPWTQELYDRIKSVENELIVISPWIKSSGIQLIKDALQNKNVNIELITRLSTRDFLTGISDLDAYQELLASFSKVNIRCVSNLHAKVYIFDRSSMILTSGNLTVGGLKNNIEAGVYINSKSDVSIFTKGIMEQIKDAPCFDLTSFNDVRKKINDQVSSLESSYKQSSPNGNKDNDQNVDLITFGKRIKPNSIEPDGYVLKSFQNKKTNIKLKVRANKIEKTDIPLPLDINEIFEKKLPKLKQKLDLLLGENLLNSGDIKDVFILPAFNEEPSSSEELSRSIWFGRKMWDLSVKRWCLDKYKSERVNVNRIADMCKSATTHDETIFKRANISKDDLIYIHASDGELEGRFSHIPMAVIGKVYSKLGLSDSHKLIYKLLNEEFAEQDLKMMEIENTKSFLQAITQEKFKALPQYQLLSSSGPDHNKLFETQVVIQGDVFGKGVGNSLKKAEAESARVALKKFTKEIDSLYKVSNEKSDSSYAIEHEQQKNIIRLYKPYFGNVIYENSKLIKSIHQSTLTKEWCKIAKIDEAYSTFDLYSFIGKSVWDILLANRLGMVKNISASNLELIHNDCQRLKGIIFAKLKLDTVYKFHKGDHILKESRAAAVNNIFGYLLVHRRIKSCQEFFDKNISNIVDDIALKAVNLKKEDLISPFNRIQTLTHEKGLPFPEYEISQYSQEGTNKIFGVNLVIGEEVYGFGEGLNFKRAKHNAALEALVKLNKNY